MALEDRIRSSVDQAVQSLLTDIITISHDEVARQVGEAEQRLHVEFDLRLAAFEQSQREQTAQEVHDAVQTAAARHAAEAQHNLDVQLRVAVAEAESRAAAAAHASLAAARATEREQEIAGMTRLVESIRGLDGAASLSEVLDALALAAARETARAAVVVVKGDRAVGWRTSGFGPRDTQPKSIDLDIRDAGVIGLAATSGRPATTRDGAGDGPGFEMLPADRIGLAVPVLVGGRVVAVVYADTVTLEPQPHAVPSPWPEVIEILGRHAGRCLEALTAQKVSTTPGAGRRQSGVHQAATSAVPEPPAAPSLAMSMMDDSLEAARRLARLLISEIRFYHEPAVREGRLGRNLLARLAPEIARAREAYLARVPAEARGNANVFDEELVRTLAGGDPTLLGVTG